MTSLTFRVYGIPIPKGSKRVFMVKGRPVLTESAKGLGEWIQSVTAAALENAKGHTMASGVPLEANLIFYLPRPKSARKKDFAPAKARNDIDKLARCVLDCLTQIIWWDDGQVVSLHAWKRYATPHDPPGVVITVRAILVDDVT